MCFLMSIFEILQIKNYRPDIALILRFDILVQDFYKKTQIFLF